MNGFLKQVSFWIILLVFLVLGLTWFSDRQAPGRELTAADFARQLESGNVKRVEIQMKADSGYRIKSEFNAPVDGQQHMAFDRIMPVEEWATWQEQLEEAGVPIDTVLGDSMWAALLYNIVPVLLLIGVFWFFMFRHMQGGSNKAMSFGKSRARLASSSDKVVTFKDVAGVDEVKEELEEVIEFLRDPKRFTRLGGKIPKGVLMVGPPGSGKTLLGRAVAGEANVPFFSISGSDFVEMFVGVGASRVRDLFQQGQKHAPCIIFIDEIDAVGRQRGAGLGGGHDEREQTLNQLLVEMDGFNTNDGVILMAATNRPDVLDKALLRPGRFDRQIVVSNPDIKGREAILDIHVRNNAVPLDGGVDLSVLARGTPGFSGADLANMVNEAALLAARRSQENVTQYDFEEAKDRVLMGPERRSLVITPEEKKSTAVHEAGHTLVARLLADADPLHKVTIIPRGPTLGATSMLPTEDRHNVSKRYCEARIRVLMGGRAAEEVVFQEFSSGAGNDLKVATQQAHAMVCEWGMSDLGPISFGSNQEVFLGRDFAKERDFSEETASAVDNAIHEILQDAYKDAMQTIEAHKDILMALADRLCERETLEGEEIDEVIREAGGADLIPPAPEKTEKPATVEKKTGASVPVDDEEDDEDEGWDGLSDMEPDGVAPGPS